MLSAARRSIFAGSSSTTTALDLRLAALSLRPRALASPFSTSQPAHEAPRLRLSKAKRAERVDKLARKRSVREIQREREERRREHKRFTEHRRVEEVRDKKAVGEDISDSLPPFSEAQLQAMYTGLLAASPADLSPSALLAAPPAAPALPGPSETAAEEREGRLTLLEERLKELEGELESEARTEEERESLAERLRRRKEGEGEEVAVEDAAVEVEVGTGDAQVPVLASSRARQVLERVEGLLPPEPAEQDAVASEGGLELPRGLLSQSEWTDLVLASAQEGDREGVFRGLKLMDRSTPISEGKILEDTLAIYASRKATQDALALASFARQNRLPLSVTAHHHLLTALLPSHPELAVRHLHSLEAAGHTPLLATYTAVVSRLLSPPALPHLVRQGWDLYAHTRAVAYPTPDVTLFSTMILACSFGAHPSPERAIDLFTEMTEQNGLSAGEMAFNGVIRACAREGSEQYYLEALRFMRRMLDENVAPSRHTFHALLEGAKKHGDLARARWVLVKMVGVGGESAPTEKTLALVLQAYAAYKPESRVRNAPGSALRDVEPATAPASAAEGEAVSADEPAEEGRPAPTLDAADDPLSLPVAPPSSSSAATQAVLELLSEASLFYPGPLPQTSAEVVAEARNLMLQVIDASVLSPPASSSDAAASTESDPPKPPADSMFPSASPNTFLLNSYLTVLNSHAPLPASLAFFGTAYSRTGVAKNRFTFEVTMKRLELAKDQEKAVDAAKGVFEEWLKWKDEEVPPFRTVEEAAEEGGEEFDERDAERWVADRRNGKTASKLWGGMIRVLARDFKEDEALKVLDRFVELYPPSLLATPVPVPRPPPASPAAPPALPAGPLPPRPIRISSPLYPETAPPLDALRPPYLLFEDLRLLHHRLAEMENKKGMRRVAGVVNAYRGALRTARKKEVKREERERR
ncbi:hypothetical protein JCM8097_002696 [Rhodosporidiobolus ruineniae]